MTEACARAILVSILFRSFDEFTSTLRSKKIPPQVMTIRVLFLEMQPMLRGILTDAVTREPDMQLLGSAPPPTDWSIGDLQPDVLVCSAADAYDTARPRALLQIVPCARVLVLAHSGRQAVAFETRLTRLTLHEVSMTGVIDAIRTPRNGYADEPDSPPHRSAQHRAAQREQPLMAGPLSGLRAVRGGLSWREKP